MTVRTVLSIVLGAAGGLAYQRFVGCRTGTCAITSNPGDGFADAQAASVA